MKYLSMLERLDEGELVRAEDGGWLEELEVVHRTFVKCQGTRDSYRSRRNTRQGSTVFLRLTVPEWRGSPDTARVSRLDSYCCVWRLAVGCPREHT